MTSDGRSEGQGRSFEETLSDQSKGSETVAVQRSDSGITTPSDPQMRDIQTLDAALPAVVTHISDAGRGRLTQASDTDFTVMPPETRSRPTDFEGPLLSDPATYVRPTLPHVDGSQPTNLPGNPMAGFPMLQGANTTGNNSVDMSVLTDVSTVKAPHNSSLPVPASTETLPPALPVALTSLADTTVVGDTRVPTPAINLTFADASALSTPLTTPATAQAATDAEAPTPKAEGNIALSTVKMPYSPGLSVPTATNSLPQTLPIATSSLTGRTVDGGTVVAAIETITLGPKAGAHIDMMAADLSYRPGQSLAASTNFAPQTLTVVAAPQTGATVDRPTITSTPTAANPAAIADARGPKVEATTDLTTVKTPNSASVPTAAATEFPPQALTVGATSPAVATVAGETLSLAPDTTTIKADAPDSPSRPATPATVQAAVAADAPALKTGATLDVSTVKLPQSLNTPLTTSSEPLPQTLTVATTAQTSPASATADGGTLAPAPATHVVKADGPALPTPPATPTTAQAATDADTDTDTDVPAPKAETKADSADRTTLSSRAADTADYRALAQSSSLPTESVKIADGPMKITPFLTNSDAPVLAKLSPVMTALPTLSPLSGMSDRLAATIMQTTQAQPNVTLDKLPQTVVAIALSAKSATLQIDPPELGRIQLDYQFDSQGRTVVTLTPESDAARAALMDRMASIIAALEQGSDKPIDVQLGNARDFGSEFDQTSQDDRGSGSNTKDGAKIAASDTAPLQDSQRFMRAPLGEAERLHILV